ncbi:MAG: twin-arginine translocase subunit TatC [Elusimicrobiota bacterium]|jgi:sec-independent protein translocase protein TatC|nr:twin-arginine translocase subunit TatC [Elusimicrobiota bacterium]
MEPSFLDHLEELRRVLLKCVCAVAVLYLPAFFAAPYVIKGIILWAAPEGAGFNYFTPLEVFILQLKLAFALASAAALPYILWQAWRFLLPALYDNERKALKLWVLSSTLLFAAGAAFCFLFILPFLMRFSLSFSSDLLRPVLGVGAFAAMAGWLMLAFGLMFQFPLAVMLAVRFGLVKKSVLKKQRPYVVVGILILAALLTPPDVISQLMLAVPTYILFELGLFLSREVK